MAKIICCDECNSASVVEIDRRKTNQHTEKRSGFWGLGGSYTTDYIYHFDLEITYQCSVCGCKFHEYDTV